MFQQLRFVILPVQTKSTADCLGGGASGCICFAGSNEINRRLSGRGYVRLHLFCWFKRNQPPIVWEGVRQVAFVLLVETRLTANWLRGVRQLASVVQPEQLPIAQF